MAADEYLLAGQTSELERLQLQSRVWEPSGQRLLEAIGPGRDRALDVGCGVLGWLRLLSRWVSPDGEVVGTDIDDAMLAAAAQFVEDEKLPNVTLIKDDLFATSLQPASFDLVHARFELTPLGRVKEQLATYLRLTRHGGVVALEDPDWGSWHYNPPAPALEALITFICEAFHRWGDAAAGTQTAAVVPTLRHRGERPSRGPGTSPRGIRTCGFHCSSRQPSNHDCSPSWTRWSWHGCAPRPKRNCESPNAGAPHSRCSSPGAAWHSSARLTRSRQAKPETPRRRTAPCPSVRPCP
jgi:SAM-dependent methyltransferase